MSVARFSREKKRQLGQFFTPEQTARAIVGELDVLPSQRILEPSFGEGAFAFAVLDAILPQIGKERARQWCADYLYGCELDKVAYDGFKQKWRSLGYGETPKTMENTDFFSWMPPDVDRAAATDKRRYFAAHMQQFDLIIGNPPFGGSIQPDIQDKLDSILGVREGRKIKKETYAFFMVKSLDLLRPGGQLVFVCSDTILTISTMAGLRSWLQNNYTVNISPVPGVFTETMQEMILISIKKAPSSARNVTVFGATLPLTEVDITPNHSWRINGEFAKYFTGASIGDKMIATSGMTVGKNDLFVRQIRDDQIEEPYDFTLVQEKITLEKELARARLGKISDQRRAKVMELEASGATETILKWDKLSPPRKIKLPDDDYAYYNKASSQILYAKPEHAIFWREQGRYVYTFKKNGNWYLHGVGGKKFFGREGLTWPLISSRLCTRYLPAGYILDSGSPCAFLRPNVPQEELFFILGWSLTHLCKRILKEVLNHTRNNQGKDFERLPYPVWVSHAHKQKAIKLVKNLVKMAMKEENSFSFKSREVQALEEIYAWRDSANAKAVRHIRKPTQEQLFSL